MRGLIDGYGRSHAQPYVEAYPFALSFLKGETKSEANSAIPTIVGILTNQPDSADGRRHKKTPIGYQFIGEKYSVVEEQRLVARELRWSTGGEQKKKKRRQQQKMRRDCMRNPCISPNHILRRISGKNGGSKSPSSHTHAQAGTVECARSTGFSDVPFPISKQQMLLLIRWMAAVHSEPAKIGCN